MAERRPIVNIGGTLQELPLTDTLGGASTPSTIVQNPVIVATAGQTVFAIPGGSASAQVRVYANGLKLEPATDYTVASDGLTYTLTEAAEAGEEFSTEVISQFSVADTYSQGAVDSLIAAATPDASETVKGLLELTTLLEAAGGMDTVRAVHAAGVFAAIRALMVGTVSQSGGVPTGAIIERGSNANGEYVKFANGTMFCSMSRSVAVTIAIAYFGGFRSGGIEVIFPASFAAAPVCSVNSVDVTSFGASTSTTSSTSTFFCFTSVTSQTSATRNAHILAEGRWF
jgi:hypothetical protein